MTDKITSTTRTTPRRLDNSRVSGQSFSSPAISSTISGMSGGAVVDDTNHVVYGNDTVVYGNDTVVYG